MSLVDTDPPIPEPPATRKRPNLAFRVPADLEEYLAPARKRGRGFLTTTIVRMLRIARDANNEAGIHYRSVIEYARTHGVTEGQALARLAVKGLERAEDESKHKHKK